LARPITAGFEVTTRCNFACRYCFRFNKTHSGGGEITLDEILPHTVLSILRDLLACHESLRILLTGGEPLTSRENLLGILRVLATVESRLDNVLLLTNGSLLTPSLSAELASALPKIEIQVSLDGPQTVHDACRHTRGIDSRTTHSAVILGIENARKAGLRVRLNAVIARPHVDLNAKLFFDYMNAFGLPWTIGKADFEDPINSLNSEEFVDFVLSMIDVWAESEDRTNARWLDGLIFMAQDAFASHGIEQCARGVIFFAGSKGYAWPCQRLMPLREYLLGSYFDLGIEPLLNHPLRSNLHRLFRDHMTCGFVAHQELGALLPIPSRKRAYDRLFGTIRTLLEKSSSTKSPHCI
jgi:sulfatase maturation enzyme AslB (radical SAM superfamily)